MMDTDRGEWSWNMRPVDQGVDRQSSRAQGYAGCMILVSVEFLGNAGWSDWRGWLAGGCVLLLVAAISVACLTREVRRRRRAESALRDANQRYDLLLAGTEAGTWDWDVLGQRVAYSPRWSQLRGYANGEVAIAGPKWNSRIHPDDAARVMAAVAAHVEGRTPVFVEEYRVQRKDGSWIWVADRGIAQRDAHGQVVRMAGSETDITERKQIEVMLERTRDTLTEIQRIAHLGSFEYDAATGTTLWSEEEYRIYGLDPTGPSPIYDVLLAKCIHPDDAGLLHETFMKALRSGGIYELEHRIVWPDGSVRWVYDRARPYFDDDGNLVRYIGATLDITDRKQAEAALRASEELNRSTLQALPAHIAVLDSAGHIITTNQAWDEFAARNQATGQPSVMVGSNYLDVCRRAAANDNDESAAEALAGIEAVMAGRTAQFSMECQCHSPVEQRWFYMTVVPLGKPGTGGAVITHLDITKRKQAESSLQQSREDLDRAQVVGQIGWWRLDTVHNVLTWSDENYRIFGITKGTPLTYEAFLSIVHPDDRADVDARWTAGLRGEPYDVEHRIVADGKVKWVREKAYLEFDANGVLLGGFGITQDISDRKAAEAALRASLQEKEVLLKEIHHRVKNNMQVISSIVSLQADQSSDPALRVVLQDVIYRVRSMALVHEKLYQSADFARVQFGEYAESLLHYLWRAHGSAAAGIRLTLDLNPVFLSVNEAVPFGLILNELASNALKHAFRDGNGHEVVVSLHAEPSGRVCLRVRDNGQGLPAGVDWRVAKSLGLQLVQILARQLHADVEAVTCDGTEFAVAFGRANP